MNSCTVNTISLNRMLGQRYLKLSNQRLKIPQCLKKLQLHFRRNWHIWICKAKHNKK